MANKKLLFGLWLSLTFSITSFFLAYSVSQPIDGGLSLVQFTFDYVFSEMSNKTFLIKILLAQSAIASAIFVLLLVVFSLSHFTRQKAPN